MSTPDSGVSDRLGLGAVGGAVTLMGIGSVVAKAAAIDGAVLAFHRAWLAAVLYLGIYFVLGGRINRAKLKAAAPGGLAFGLQLALFFSAIQRTTVANASMILALQPVLVLLFFSKRFGETVGKTEWWLSAAAMAGVSLVLFGSTASPSWSPFGDLLAAGALVMWTLYFVYSKTARRTLGAVEYQGISLMYSCAVVLPIALSFSGTLDVGPGKWPWALAMAATPGTGHILMNWAHARVPIGLVSQMTLASPVVSIAVAAVVLTNETVNFTQIAGMAVVLGALGLLLRQRSR